MLWEFGLKVDHKQLKTHENSTLNSHKQLKTHENRTLNSHKQLKTHKNSTLNLIIVFDVLGIPNYKIDCGNLSVIIWVAIIMWETA